MPSVGIAEPLDAIEHVGFAGIPRPLNFAGRSLGPEQGE